MAPERRKCGNCLPPRSVTSHKLLLAIDVGERTLAMAQRVVHQVVELSGHRSDRYIWRYVRPDAQSLAEAIDDLD
jgi:hypothetical protein